MADTSQEERQDVRNGPAQNGQVKEKQPEAGQQQEEEQQPEKPKEPVAQRARHYAAQHPGRVLLGLVALVVLIVAGTLLWIYLSSYESTDDAQVDGHINM